METLKSWRNAYPRGDVWRNEAFGTDNEDDESSDEDSFFDLVLDRVASRRGAEMKEFQFVESPRDVFKSKNDSSNSKPPSPFALLRRSNPKFRVFTLGFRKCDKTESNADLKGSSLNRFSKSTRIESSNYSKCRVPVDSSLIGDNTLRSQLLLKEISDCETSSGKSSTYLVPKVIKPLYMKFWKWRKEKARFANSLANSSSQRTAPVNSSTGKLSERSRAGSFMIAAKHLGKNRPAVRVAPSPACRRDDSLLEQHDGIQGAVLYCKKSYNSSSKEISQLFRSSSDPSHEKSRHQWRNSCEQPKRCSI